MKAYRPHRPPFLYLMHTVCALGVIAQSLHAETSANLSSLKQTFEELKSDAFAEETRLRQLYEKALGNAIKHAQTSGDLDQVLDLRAELENYRSRGSAFEFSQDPELARLQKTYQAQYGEILTARAEVLRNLYSGYIQRLSSLQDSLTRSGNIEAALAVKEELEKAGSENALLEPDKAGEDLIRPDTEVDERAEELRAQLVGEWEYAYDGRTWRRILFPDGRVELWLGGHREGTHFSDVQWKVERKGTSLISPLVKGKEIVGKLELKRGGKILSWEQYDGRGGVNAMNRVEKSELWSDALESD